MKALLMKRPGEVEVTELPLPDLSEDEVLIQVGIAGICTNDMRDFKGDCAYSYPRIGGHEYGGIIAALGNGVDASRFPIGAKVVSYIIRSCGTCHFCRTGNENICFHHQESEVFHNPDGISGYCGFAEYVKAKAKDLFVFKDSTSFEKMAFTEPLACVVNSIHRTDIQFGDDVVVMGGGTMGLLHVMALRLKGARIIVSEPQEERGAKALELGAADVIDPIHESLKERVMELTNGVGAKAVYNTTASPDLMGQALDITAPCGTAVAFSSMHPNRPILVDAGAMHSLQKTLTGAVSPTIRAFYESYELIDKGILDPTRLLESVFDYRDFYKAMECALRPDTYKVLLRFGDFA